MNSALGLRRFNRFNDGDFDRDDRFRRFDRFKEIIFIGDYGFHGGWVLDGAGTGATHTDPIRPTTPATDMVTMAMAMVMGRPVIITDMATPP